MEDPISFKSDIVAKDLLEKVTSDLDFSIPDINLDDSKYTIPSELIDKLQQAINPITIEQFTTKQIDGTGVFDIIMSSLKTHLQEEFNNNRITGSEYANAYISLTNSALQTALQFLLNRDTTILNSITAQINAINGVISNASAKVALATAQAQAHTQKAQYANSVLQLATQDAQYAGAKEQAEAQRAQTQDTRLDGLPMEGVAKRNFALLEQQKTSFQHEDEYKVVKQHTDYLSVVKAQDEGLETPSELNNDSINKVLKQYKESVGFEE